MSINYAIYKLIMQLTDLGWNSFFEVSYSQYSNEAYSVMRVIRASRGKYIALNEAGEFNCEVSGKFKFETVDRSLFPVVGDWVLASIVGKENKAIISVVLPRKTCLSRKVAGKVTEKQVLASNIDTIFIVVGLDLNFNIRRIERFLSIAWDSGAEPVILLNKSDICENSDFLKKEVETIAIGVAVYKISAHTKAGLDDIYKYIQKSKTVAFIGSSGVGKSTIINAITGYNLLKVNDVSELGCRGKHTTTSRELYFIENSGMLIDTPGIREIQTWQDDEGVNNTFSEIEILSTKCKYRDCKHENEPNCAVIEGIKNGIIEKKRFDSYLKLKKEFVYLVERQVSKASFIEKSHWKDISKYAKLLKKNK